MNELEVDSFLTSDYIYIPFDDKEKISFRSNGVVYKNDLISEHKGKNEFSPVSGKAFGYGQINSTVGMKNVLVIENDFKDKVQKKLISNRDIYDISETTLKELTFRYVKCKNLVLVIPYDDGYDVSGEYLLKDNIIEVLETLNLIDQTYDDLNVKIRLDKRDVISYQTLFSYLGTYPNIEVLFQSNSEEETVVSLYDVIDIYDRLKNRNFRDYIYLSVVYDNKITVVKTKKNSNLKDLLMHLSIMSTKIVINNKIKIENGNFMLDESVKVVNIN
jgi:hypothetical protein